MQRCFWAVLSESIRVPRMTLSQSAASVALTTGLLALAQAVAFGAAPLQAEQPDLVVREIHTIGLSQIGDCNRVGARFANVGEEAAPGFAVELRITRGGWQSEPYVARHPGLAAGGEGRLWFPSVELAGPGLHHLVISLDTENEVSEADESNNIDTLGRDPRSRCGEDALPRGRAHDLEIEVSDDHGNRLAGVRIASTRTDEDLGTTDENGALVLRQVRPDPTSRPATLGLRAIHEGCEPVEWREPLIMARHDRRLTLHCGSDDKPGEANRSAATATRTGVTIRAEIPCQVLIDGNHAGQLTFGEQLTLATETWQNDSASLLVLSLAGTTALLERTLEAGDPAVVIDSDDRFRRLASGLVEDLHTGLTWTPAPADPRAPEPVHHGLAVERCEQLERDGHRDWRLADIDEINLLYDDNHPERLAALLSLDGCCMWSASLQGSDYALSFYVRAGHIYPRTFEAEYFPYVCVRGTRHQPDKFTVPQEYWKFLERPRRFRPPER